MSEVYVLVDKLRKARKQHTCELCASDIQRGDTYHYNKYAIPEGVYAWKECLSCHELVLVMLDATLEFYDYEDGYNLNSVLYFVEDVLDYDRDYEPNVIEMCESFRRRFRENCW